MTGRSTSVGNVPSATTTWSPIDPILVLFFFLTTGIAVEFVLQKLPRSVRLPYTLVIFLIGIGYGSWLHNGDPGLLKPGLQAFGSMDAHLFLYTFIPPLLFIPGLELNAFVLKKQFMSSSLMAFGGVCVAVCITSLLIKPVVGESYGWNWSDTFMFSSIASATDPVAVVSLLHTLGAPEHFSLLIDGEALLNDGSASVLFFIFFSYVQAQGVALPTPNAGNVIDMICRLALGSIAIGLIFAVILTLALSVIWDQPHLEIGLTLAAAWLCFWVAEGTNLHGSGIFATVTLALLFSLKGVRMISPKVMPSMHHTWETIGWVANTLVFITAGMLVDNYAISTTTHTLMTEARTWGLAFYIYFVVHVSRIVSIALCYPFLRRSPYGFDIQRAVVYAWSGLRGAIGLALAIIVYHDTYVDTDLRNEVVMQISILVFLTLAINGSTTEWLYIALGLGDQPEGRHKIVDVIVNEIEWLAPKTEDGMRAMPFFRDLRFQQKAHVRQRLYGTLHARPSALSSWMRSLTPQSWLHKDHHGGSVDRAYANVILRLVRHEVKVLFNDDVIGSHGYRLLSESAAFAEVAVGYHPLDLVRVQFDHFRQEGLLRQATRKLVRVPLLGVLFRCFGTVIYASQARFVIETGPSFLYAHHQALKQARSDLPPYITTHVQAQLAEVEQQMKAMYQMKYHADPRAFIRAAEDYFALCYLNCLTQHIRRFAKKGLISHSEQEAMEHSIFKRKHTIDDWQKYFVLLGLPWKGEERHTLVPPSFPFPPDMGEIATLVRQLQTQLDRQSSNFRHFRTLGPQGGPLHPHFPTLPDFPVSVYLHPTPQASPYASPPTIPLAGYPVMYYSQCVVPALC